MKKKIGVIFGGRSAEHEVSIITAHIPIIQALQASGRFEVYPIYISKDGSWFSKEDFLDLEFFKDPDFENKLNKEKKINLRFNNGLEIIWPGLRQKFIRLDVVFPAMHGTYGEDGSLMGLLRMANIPFVGCDLFASAVAMDKVLTKQILFSQEVSIVPYVWFNRIEWEEQRQLSLDKVNVLKYPLFVKPPHLGSSIGISKVRDEAELINAIEVALHYDDKVLVEQSIENLIEVTLPIMGNENPQPAEVERPLAKSEFFNFEDKYLSGSKNPDSNSNYSELPAKLDNAIIEQVKDLGLKTYKILGCEGIARVDFLIDQSTGKIYVNEVNTLPGSLYHHNWRAAGISAVELVVRLVELAEERFGKQQKTTFAFSSAILNKLKGSKIGQ